MLIRNIQVYGYGQEGDLTNIYINSENKIHILNDEKSEKNFTEATNVVDAEGKYSLMPGWFDTHVHGFGGPDFIVGDKEKLKIITKKLGETGLSYCVATLVSSSIPTLKKAVEAINNYVVEQNKHPIPGATNIVAIHLEGPFIDKCCKGAHDETLLQEIVDIEIFKEIINAALDISEWKITIAPNLKGALEFIKEVQQLKRKDGRDVHVNVFLGHTKADEKIIQAAIKAGAVGFTHLGNANGETAQRLAGQPVTIKHITSPVVRQAIANQDNAALFSELIVDGAHLSQEFVTFIKKTLGNQIVFVTDALGPSGCPDGDYLLGTLSISKKNEKFFIKNTGTLAGSGATFAQIIKKYADMMGETNRKLMEDIYLGAVKNARKSTLHSSVTLPDDKNFVIVNQAGELVMSVCNGKVMTLLPEFLLKKVENISHSIPKTFQF